MVSSSVFFLAHASHPEGYDAPFLEDVREELQCPICMLVARDAAVTEECGHLFCQACIEESIKRVQECPVCRLKVDDSNCIRRDVRARREIGNIEVGCPNQRLGCGWKSTLLHLDTHLSSECGYATIICSSPYCSASIQRRFISEHAAQCLGVLASPSVKRQMDQAATKIQSNYRGHRTRLRFKQIMALQDKAMHAHNLLFRQMMLSHPQAPAPLNVRHVQQFHRGHPPTHSQQEREHAVQPNAILQLHRHQALPAQMNQVAHAAHAFPQSRSEIRQLLPTSTSACSSRQSVHSNTVEEIDEDMGDHEESEDEHELGKVDDGPAGPSPSGCRDKEDFYAEVSSEDENESDSKCEGNEQNAANNSKHFTVSRSYSRNKLLLQPHDGHHPDAQPSAGLQNKNRRIQQCQLGYSQSTAAGAASRLTGNYSLSASGNSELVLLSCAMQRSSNIVVSKERAAVGNVRPRQRRGF